VLERQACVDDFEEVTVHRRLRVDASEGGRREPGRRARPSAFARESARSGTRMYRFDDAVDVPLEELIRTRGEALAD